MTQRTASTRLDLPQPFGPTTPVSPGSISKSVGSTKDLKPIRRSRVSFIRWSCPSARCGARKSLTAHALRARESQGCRIGAENESSRLPSATAAAVLSRLSPATAWPAVRRDAGHSPPAEPKNPYPALR